MYDKKSDEQKSLRYFLLYAFPCTSILLMQGRITKERIAYLEDILKNDKEIKKEYLASIFTTAYEQLKIINSSLPFAIETVQEYFLRRHNSFVNTQETVPENLKPFCRIQEARIEEIIDKEQTRVHYTEVEIKQPQQRIVSRKFFPELNLGSKVRIHYWHVSEKL